METDILQRSRLLYGDTVMERLAGARVIVFGVGGVGSWCAETLLRTGIGHITLVDADCVDITNINRQLPATSLTVGRPKADVLRERFLEIMPSADVRSVVKYYDAESADSFDMASYDVVVDAIDSVQSKAHLILECTSIPTLRLFSSMGAARRADPSRVADAEFRNVKGCPLARALRDRFRKNGTMPRRKFRCVYSDEAVKGAPKGTSMAVTATFGLRLASLVINYLQTSTPSASLPAEA